MNLFDRGFNRGELLSDFAFAFYKLAEAPETSYSMVGRLYLSKSGWILLNVPNALVRGAFDAISEPGVELPPQSDGGLNAHISVIRPEELESIGGPDKITERGHMFSYTLGPLKTVTPHGWTSMSKVWMIEVKSPELEKLRKSYGLTPLPNDNKFKFHITVAVRRKNVLFHNDVRKAAADAKGIPDRRYYGDPSKIQPGSLLDFVIQRHMAERAGPHFDVRFGDPAGLHSWATRKPLPAPGGRVALFQQPVHSFKYKDWEGTIPTGQYGAGRVKRERGGKLLFTKVEPGALHFTTADKKHPERFVLIKPKGWKERDWLLINKTPTEMLPYEKVRYKKIPAEQVEQAVDQMQEGETLEAKLDGASSLVKVLKDGVELVSYRKSKETGRPILHTERFFHGQPDLKIPDELAGTVLKGELYGQQDEDGRQRVIAPQELGAILNSSLAESIRKQKEKGISLRDMIYDIQQLGKQPIDWHQVPRTERRKMIEQVLQHLPQDRFHISPAADKPEEARKLWQQIQSGEHPLTNEGVVFWPQSGTPWKSKLVEDADVYVRGVFPGEGKYKDVGAGGFEYSLEPEGPVTGRVGTGFTDEMRQALWQNPDDFVGRIARIRSQQQLPSGAYRAPSLIALHEDYPQAGIKRSSSTDESLYLTIENLVELGIMSEKSAERFFIGEAINNRLRRPLNWNTRQPFLQNAANLVGDVTNDAVGRMRAARNDKNLVLALQNPGANEYAGRLNRLVDELHHGDRIVTSPYDQLLERLA